MRRCRGRVGGLKQKDNAPLADCRHCGTPVPVGRTDGFCCTGCGFVFNLMMEEGFERFYDLKGGRMLSPVAPEALRERDYEWLETQLAAAEQACAVCDGRAELRLSVQGLSCVGCVWLIERVFARLPGALRVNVDVMHGDMRLEWQAGVFDGVGFARELQGFGYLLGPAQARGAADRRERSGLEKRMGACGAFAMNAMAFSLPAYFGMPKDFPFASWFTLIAAASATLAMIVGGSYFIERSWKSLRAGVLHIDTPIALGIVAAYAGSLGGWAFGVEGLLYFDFVAMFVFLMLTGRWAQQSAVERNRRKLMRDTSIPEHVRLSQTPKLEAPDRLEHWPLNASRSSGGIVEDAAAANRKALSNQASAPLKHLELRNSGLLEKDQSLLVAEIAKGVCFRVKPGQTLPVAARLLSEQGSVSLEWINGESEVQRREGGQLLPSGVLNVGVRELEVEALEGWEESTLNRLLEARRETEFRDQGLERLLRGYLAVVVVVGLAGAVWWWQHEGVASALQVMISVFVVSCPCALGVAVPLAEELASSRAERLGVFVRSLGLWKKLLRLKRVVFDKTGTLTLENPVLMNAEVIEGLDEEGRAALRRLVTGNLHPVSRSLFDAVGPGVMLEGEVEERVGEGLGLRATGGATWTLGRPGLWRNGGLGAEAVDVELCRDGVFVAGFAFRESLRPDTVEEVQRLRARGLAVAILSGDREEKVAGVAGQLGLAKGEWEAGLDPAGKARWLVEHEAGHALFIGDGANDSLAFDAALCAGSPVTGRSFLEQKADFFFLGYSLRFVSGLIGVARQHRVAVRRVFAFSVLYNLSAAGFGLAGHLNPLLAAILMPLSSLATMSLVAWTFRARLARVEVETTRHEAEVSLA
jgi:P-type Cu2+ transporter